MNTFSDSIFRSHPGSDPHAKGMVQPYDTKALAAHFGRFAHVFANLAPYKKDLMAEAYATGVPLCRPMMLHYPDDSRARATSDQLMLGPELIMAPIFKHDASTRDVYLPRGSGVWVQLSFTSPTPTGDAMVEHDCSDSTKDCSIKDAPSPLGSPLVFILKNGAHYDVLKGIAAVAC
jgi:hypothetical protein